MDAFISHSSQENPTAERLEEELEAAGLEVWTDLSDMTRGPLVDAELLKSIRACKLLLLLWSKAAGVSKWVAAEWLVAFHEGKLVVPCVLDSTPLPQCLQKAAHVDMRWPMDRIVKEIRRTAEEAEDTRTQIVVPVRGRRPQELDQQIWKVVAAQTSILSLLDSGDLTTARAKQKKLDREVQRMKTLGPHDTLAVTVEGYHHKNAYQIAHHDEIQAGIRPPDALLDQAERCFFRALAIDPTDHAALNGMGNYRWFVCEFQAAEFFTLKAIEFGRRAKEDVSPYEHDLRLIRRDLAANQ